MFDSYSITESELFCAQRDAISPDVRRMDDLMEAVMWGLGENPEQFHHVTGSLWLARTDPFPGAPTLRIWFKLGNPDDHVELLSCELIEDGDEA